MSEHRCHAKGCDVAVDPQLLMCLRHWRRVPRRLQNDVWKFYRPGQEVDKNPSREYLAAAAAAIEAVAKLESGNLFPPRDKR